MTEILPSKISASTNDSLELNTETEDILEMIGQKILSTWSDDQESSFLSQSTLSVDPLQQIETILSMSPEKLPPNWDSKLRKLIEELSPTDFAVYGKKICLSILDIKAKTLSKTSSPSSPRINHTLAAQNSLKHDNEKDRMPSVRSERSYLRQIRKASPNKSRQVLNAQIYNEFPQWLPTITDY